jgi:hypothetical protein
MKTCMLVLAMTLVAFVVSGCGSTPHRVATKASQGTCTNVDQCPNSYSKSQHESPLIQESKQTKIKAKHKTRVRTAQTKKLREYEQSPEYKKIQAEMRQGEEYERDHKPEEEAHEQEYERRARGELTPEEQKNQEAREHEAGAEAEAIREGERLKEEGK